MRSGAIPFAGIIAPWVRAVIRRNNNKVSSSKKRLHHGRERSEDSGPQNATPPETFSAAFIRGSAATPSPRRSADRLRRMKSIVLTAKNSFALFSDEFAAQSKVHRRKAPEAVRARDAR